jgi:hypothetical protein
MHDDIQELKARIVAGLDVVDFLDLIGFTLADLVEVLEEEIEENYTQLDRACR